MIAVKTGKGIPPLVPCVSITMKVQMMIHYIFEHRFGLNAKNDGIAIYAFDHFTFKSHYYGYLYLRMVNDPDAFPR